MIVGVDEAGRGPLAGPVVAAAVILDELKPIKGLADSKKLTAKTRDRLFDEIRAKVEQVTAAQVRDLANEWYDPSALTTLLYAPVDSDT